MAELLIGCGNNRRKVITQNDTQWSDLTTLDNDPNCGADVEWDLMRLPLPFPDEKFDEIHAYHVLEHTGAQGDYRWFFAQFAEFYRILKPGGLFCAAVPARASIWAWGDPGHSRIFEPTQLTYLDQTEYTKQVGVTALADYRRFFRGDFEKIYEQLVDDREQVLFAIRAVKPSRISI